MQVSKAFVAAAMAVSVGAAAASAPSAPAQAQTIPSFNCKKARTFIEVDNHQQLRHLVGEQRVRRFAADGEGVQGAGAGDIFPVEVGCPAARADDAGVVDPAVAGAALLDADPMPARAWLRRQMKRRRQTTALQHRTQRPKAPIPGACRSQP